MNKTSNKDFQKRPIWVFITVIIILIGSAPAFNELILDFKPHWCLYSKWIKLSYIVVFFIIMIKTYWDWHIKEEPPSNEKHPRNEPVKKSWRRIVIMNLFKEYFFNIITLKIIPIFFCKIISLFVKKSISPYSIESFAVPKTWPGYQKIIDIYFKAIFRVIIKASGTSGKVFYKTYEVKFKRDFQCIELRWNSEDDDKFQPPIQGKYENIFSEDREDIKIFTWITPFGLCWNLIRVMKFFIKKIKTYRQ